MNQPSLLDGERFPVHAEVSLPARFAEEIEQDRRSGVHSRFTDPYVSAGLIARDIAREKLSFHYGGFREDRGDFLHGSYLTLEDKRIHLGVDVNVPTDTPVYACHDATTVLVRKDLPDERFGWGHLIILRLVSFPVYLIIGHLIPSSLVRIGSPIKAGSKLGSVASPIANGGWWPHIHIQAMTLKGYQFHKERDFKTLDGYARADDKEAREFFIDPRPYIILP